MKLNEYLFNEYKTLTNKYISASQQIRELLPRFTLLPDSDTVPKSKTCKELLRELDKIEWEIEISLARLRNIRRRLLELI
jgi:hypothetical protein